MVKIWIDGASRGNGKSDCLAVGAALINDNDKPLFYKPVVETNSTSQRGELSALLLALEYIQQKGTEDYLVITDSEYIYNTMYKEWYVNWQIKGWISSTGAPIKNQDLWEKVITLVDDSDMNSVNFYHIKGHVLKLSKKVCATLIRDFNLDYLYNIFAVDYSEVSKERVVELEECFYKNHGFSPTQETLRTFVAGNMVVDSIATYIIDAIKELDNE